MLVGCAVAVDECSGYGGAGMFEEVVCDSALEVCVEYDGGVGALEEVEWDSVLEELSVGYGGTAGALECVLTGATEGLLEDPYGGGAGALLTVEVVVVSTGATEELRVDDDP